MALKNIANRLVFSCTQSGADTFTEESFETGLATIGQGANIALRIIEIGVQFSFPSAEADSYIEVAVTRQSQAAIPQLTERSLILKLSKRFSITTSGAVYVPDNVQRWQPSPEASVLVVENPLYIQVASGATGSANVAYGYMLYEQVKITENERLSLLAQSLAGS